METKNISSITLSGAGRTFQVLYCQVVRSVNAIQQASVTIATGYNVTTGQTIKMDLTAAQLRTTEFVLQIKGSVNCEIFRGYVISVPKSTAMGPQGSKIMTSFKLIGAGQAMVNMVTGAYRYWGPVSLPSRQMPASKNMMFLTKANFGKSLDIMMGQTKIEDDVGGYLVKALGTMQELYTERKGEAARLAALFDPNLIVSITPDIVSYRKTTYPILGMLSKAWQGSSVWTALMSLCRSQMFLNVIPSNHKLAIIPAFPWFKTASKSLDSSELLSAGDEASTGALLDDIDAVFVEVAGDAKTPTSYIGYPLEAGYMPKAAGEARIVSIPAWLAPFSAQPLKWSIKDKNGNKRTAADIKAYNDEVTKNTKNTPQLASALAQAFFAEAKNRQIVTNLVIPWYRFDFMNMVGYVIKVTNLQTGGSSTATVYGMLAAMVFTARSSPEGSSATMQLSLQHVRDEATNSQYGLDANPIYALNGLVNGVPTGGAATSSSNPGDAAAAGKITSSVTISNYGVAAPGGTSIASLITSGATSGKTAQGTDSVGGENSAFGITAPVTDPVAIQTHGGRTYVQGG